MDDSSIMPFGKYKGAKMEDVPDGYLAWLWDEAEAYNHANSPDPVRRELHEYIKSCLSEIGKKYVIKHQPKK